MRKLLCLIAAIACAATPSLLAQTKTIAKNPYIGAIALDANTGKVLFEDKADIPGYPASTLKLMTLLVIQEKIDAGELKLTDLVRVSVKASKTGGSQVWLDPREKIRVEDLLYALMIKSANDAAVALAEHIAGSAEAFVALMNAKAAKLGMDNTRFASVHGLPPSAGQKHDVTTARDMGILCRELCKHPAAFAYTSTPARQFRALVDATGENAPVYVPNAKPVDMTTHNPFLKPATKIEGCDGFKTGWTVVAGYSIATTCKRANRRVIVVVLGSDTLAARDTKARELLEQAFANLAQAAP
ncbi:MAG: D-alanyl-D-alanine carboxypeptidase [Kiritimatiellaeota bacterium]|nr:D-alanyl-D-alanine carboxypeptidase [Kiritimatiellota bacterium]